MEIEKQKTKKEFEEMLRHFDVPYKKMKSNTYLIGKDIVIQFLGNSERFIGLEEY